MNDKTEKRISKDPKSALFEALIPLAEKNSGTVSKLIEDLKKEITKAVKLEYPDSDNIEINIVPETKKFEVKLVKTVVDGEPENPGTQISLDEAKAVSKSAKVGKDIKIKLDSKHFLRVAHSGIEQMRKAAEQKAALFEALRLLAKENSITIDILAENLKQGILKAAKRDYPDCENIVVIVDPENEEFEVKIVKTIVDGEPEDPGLQISLEEAKKYSEDAKIGEELEIKLDTKRFGRVAASSAKQSIKQDIKGYERERLMAQFDSKREECVSAIVAKVEPATLNAVVTIDGNEAYLRRSEQIPGEVLKAGDNIQVYVETIVDTEKRPALKITRTKREMVKKLFEREVPEIYDGTVEIKSISREAGSRTKIAVWSKDKNVDAVGSCIGPKHTRISAVVKELRGEKIDIIPYSEDDAEFIANALSPAQVISVEILDGDVRSCRVVVPNNQLSLAIGNKGQNAKLAHHLTNYKIDIVPETPVNDWE